MESLRSSTRPYDIIMEARERWPDLYEGRVEIDEAIGLEREIELEIARGGRAGKKGNNAEVEVGSAEKKGGKKRAKASGKSATRKSKKQKQQP